jgi:hypothetical protein
VPAMRVPLLLITLGACGVPATAEVTSTLSETAFVIHALGNRCIGVADRNETGLTLVIQRCDGSISQMFFTGELDGRHDIQLVPAATPNQCVTILGPLAPGAHLGVTPCFATPTQRFAFDGDALMVGAQPSPTEPITRDFVIEPLESNTNEGTPVVVGTRDLDDAEYWRMVPVDDKSSKARPHSGFVTIETDVDLALYLAFAHWGQVLELDPLDDETVIALTSFPFATVSVPPGVTLRGGRKFMDNGVLLDVPDDREEEQKGFLLKVEDYARVTQLRLEGVPSTDEKFIMFGIQIGTEVDKDPAPDPTHVIVDHVELSHWTESAISMFGAYPSPYDLMECSGERRPVDSDALLVGNFSHHNGYGVKVAQGATAFVRGNLMFRENHHVTSSFYNGFNRYLAFDNMFLDHEEIDLDRAVLDVHGACTMGRWSGGRAGDYFEAGFNSYLSKRAPLVNVRGTPCDHFSFHHNVAVREGTTKTLGVDTDIPEPLCTDPNDPHCVVSDNCKAFVAGNPATILQVHPINDFEIENPLDKRLAVGDFDGDGRDDVFVATGVTWWFSSGGKAEWRLLNRMPQRTSELIFGDFDADERTDVVTMIDDRLMVSWAGGSRWFPLTDSLPNMTIEDIAVGQFDSDARADLFFGDGSRWFWAPNGGGWQQFGISGYKVADLRFGDFTGDGLTDVFNSANGTWKIVKGVWQPWQTLGSAQLPGSTASLAVADFDGDGIADVAADYSYQWNSVWMMSSGGTATASPFAVNDQHLLDLPVGRFDDNAGADVLSWDDDLWFWLSSPFASERWSRQLMR